jgi:hypothetical protein
MQERARSRSDSHVKAKRATPRQADATSRRGDEHKGRNGHRNGHANGHADGNLHGNGHVPLNSQGDASRTFDRAGFLTALKELGRGNFSVRLPHHWEGLDGKIADAFNEVVERHERLAGELARLSHVVGKQGKLTERASIGDVSGAWADTIT